MRKTAKAGWALLLCLAPFWLAAAPAEVRVGAYHFPPYVDRPEQGGAHDLLVQLLEVLNEAQDEHVFHLVPTSATRRYRDFAQGRFDLIFFESPAWGWQGIPFEGIDLHLEDEEIFVAARLPGRSQRYFERLAGKRLALYQGYHYAFADFNPDQDYLVSNYNAVLTYSHDSNLLMVTRQRVDIALVPRSLLAGFAQRHPEHARRLMASARADQVYRHHALLRPDAAIDAAGLRALLEQLRERGELARIFEPSGVRLVPGSKAGLPAGN